MSSVDHAIAKAYWSLVTRALVGKGVYIRNKKPIDWQTLELLMERSGYKRSNVLNPLLMVEPALHKFGLTQS